MALSVDDDGHRGSGDSNSIVCQSDLPLGFPEHLHQSKAAERSVLRWRRDLPLLLLDRCIVDRFFLCSKFTDVTVKRFLLSLLLDGLVVQSIDFGNCNHLNFSSWFDPSLLQLLSWSNTQVRPFPQVTFHLLRSICTTMLFSSNATPTRHCKHLHRQKRFSSRTENLLSSHLIPEKKETLTLHPLLIKTRHHRPESSRVIKEAQPTSSSV